MDIYFLFPPLASGNRVFPLSLPSVVIALLSNHARHHVALFSFLFVSYWHGSDASCHDEMPSSSDVPFDTPQCHDNTNNVIMLFIMLLTMSCSMSVFLDSASYKVACSSPVALRHRARLQLLGELLMSGHQ